MIGLVNNGGRSADRSLVTGSPDPSKEIFSILNSRGIRPAPRLSFRCSRERAFGRGPPRAPAAGRAPRVAFARRRAAGGSGQSAGLGAAGGGRRLRGRRGVRGPREEAAARGRHQRLLAPEQRALALLRVRGERGRRSAKARDAERSCACGGACTARKRTHSCASRPRSPGGCGRRARCASRASAGAASAMRVRTSSRGIPSALARMHPFVEPNTPPLRCRVVFDGECEKTLC